MTSPPHPFSLPPLLLASASPRRRALLSEVGVACEVVPSHHPEEALPGEAVEAHVARLARAKGEAVATTHRSRWVVAGDTVVALGGAILGKPASPADARHMLARLSGCTHRVVGGLAVGHDRVWHVAVATTEVRFRWLRPDEIDAYVAGGEPMDKAGAYAVQGEGRRLVAGWEGSYTNIIGLCVPLLRRLFAEAEAPYRLTPPPALEGRDAPRLG
ncbi:MAG: septum formation protein Maf [Nitrospirae bacterium CG18_big_fil_WC_8_21_14_2_50_70_55]|nr:septum formation protein Maf [Deltaproteobacteria bacterium]OIP66126.1 MAG: septum formation protein Maf [Nitrospirae bacterium CG2_30_70_394]PIQ03250.1 MAG: septum formation protein Maf [Nitrospirae bacterium CG18_big_fil_WC_8_21_14_2_50_70_55]PIU77489.1 MAG: septum formation protein Maf [Nitrospirae bacterium CG06_land_8_20_14_3_00_70_43]PIW83067.1 MAG: septum formation protein Maf [Nitrospirae bacterium CG_4_8_14_3_um_filter_70_85]PIX83272.1 MAG: septum formation protein Maf [Nitrospirae